VSLSASLEDYLEAVLLLVRQRRVARVRDIAGRVGVSMPSVNTALKRGWWSMSRMSSWT